MRRFKTDVNVDRGLMEKLFKVTVTCPDGHMNTKTAKVCWKCGKSMKGA